MKSIFITGIAGMLGSNLAYLLRKDFKVFGVDLHEIKLENVTGYVFSALDMEQMKEQLIKNHIDILIHCAALVNVDECELNPDYARRINYSLTDALTAVCEELKIQLIFISTDAVFDGTKDGLYTEDDIPNPISVYGKTKLAAEQAVLSVDDNLVARTNIYGFNYREKSSFGEWILTSLISNIELNMFYDILFSPILVNELAVILKLCFDKQLKGLYHISSTGSISKYDIAVAIMEEFGIYGCINKVSMENYQFKAPRTRNMGLSNQKLSRALELSIRTPLEGVKEFKRLYDAKYYEALRSGY
jgi:dTDP-4-dehydrorhamnose reductase